MRISTPLALTPLLLLAACGGGNDANNVVATNETPVAAADAPAGQKWVDVVTRSDVGGYVLGNPNAAIKLVEYGSRGCPTCGRFAAEGMEPLREKYISTGKVSYEFRDFLVHGAPDFSLALLNQCVPTESFFTVLEQQFAAQNAFYENAVALQKSNPQQVQRLQSLPPAEAAVGFAEAFGHIEFMKQRGLTEVQARTCLADKAKIENIAKVNAEASTVYGATGTPTFLINGKVLPNTAIWSQVEPALQAAGAR